MFFLLVLELVSNFCNGKHQLSDTVFRKLLQKGEIIDESFLRQMFSLLPLSNLKASKHIHMIDNGFRLILVRFLNHSVVHLLRNQS